MAQRITAKLPDVESRLLPGGYGYVVIRSFADQAVVEAFDAALLRFRDTPGLVIDVRQNGGGDTAVARPIMGRFIAERTPYARMRRRDGDHLSDPWTEVVDPRGPFTYTAPVAVLTTRWSASMAEGFPMGMRGIGRATIVGTPMMRLGAGVFPLHLDRTGIQLQYSAEPVYDVHDRARSLLEPDVPVSPTDDILAAGIVTLDAKRKAPSY
ncbi:S41 family peptidase [Sphingomonas bacterium]|uniref:S41 family peptidase n=1 Tax=Sphingomonas bacterium TaxID=1895847 RepID=UPI0020C691B9|nr:S41 family peptidase [Sphingomonas bacterium]